MIFLVYCGGQFNWWRIKNRPATSKWENLPTRHRRKSNSQSLGMIGINWFNRHTITATTATYKLIINFSAWLNLNESIYQNLVFVSQRILLCRLLCICRPLPFIIINISISPMIICTETNGPIRLFRIMSIPTTFRLFLVLTSEQIGRRLPVITLLLWQRQHIIVVDAVDYK